MILNLVLLGAFDATGNAGLNANELVGLYNSSGTLLSSATVLAGTADPLVDGFRWVNISPVTLTAGQTYVADLAPDALDAWAYTNLGQHGSLFSPSITYGTSLYTYDGAGLHFPTGDYGYESYLGPGLSVGAVPEASTIISGAMLLLPFGGRAVRQLRKRFHAA